VHLKTLATAPGAHELIRVGEARPAPTAAGPDADPNSEIEAKIFKSDRADQAKKSA
jgi:hypothetical protein